MTLLDKFQILVSTLSILKESPGLGYYEVKSRMNGSDRSFQNLWRQKIKKISAVRTKQERKWVILTLPENTRRKFKASKAKTIRQEITLKELARREIRNFPTFPNYQKRLEENSKK